MQVQSNYTSAFYSRPKGIGPEASEAYIERRPPQAVLEEMLSHLRADPMIGSRISDNGDGTYSFDMTAGAWNDKSFAASAIISELNSGHLDRQSETMQIKQNLDDAQLFKQITNYSLLTLAGQTWVLDTNGYPPKLEDQGLVRQALELVQDIAKLRAIGALQGELTLDNVFNFLSSELLSEAALDLTNRLLKALGDHAEAGFAQEGKATVGEGREIADLIEMVSI